MNTRFFLHRAKPYGVEGDPLDAVRAEHPFERLNASDFLEVRAEEYENTILDGRFEDGEWQQ